MTSTDNTIGDIGITSLSNALIANTTLTTLDMKSQIMKRKQIINNALNNAQSTDIGIEEMGAISLSESLKINTTLIKLDLGCKHR